MKTMKGQSAVEYMTTYGWAILVLGIVLVLLFSSGIFSPTYLISEECTIGTKLICNAIIFQDGDALRIAINASNGFGYMIKIKNIDIVLSDDQKSFELDDREFEVESGDSILINGRIDDYRPIKGAIKKANIQVDYYSCAPEINPECTDISTHKISGRIIGKVN